IDASGLDRWKAAPQRMRTGHRIEVRIYGDDDIRIPAQHLLDRDLDQTALTQLGGDVNCSDLLYALDIDRAGEPRIQALRPSSVVHARALIRGYFGDAARNVGDGVLRVARKRLRPLFLAGYP